MLKRDNLFIYNEEKRYETPSHTAAALSIIFLLAFNTWNIQSNIIRSQRLKSVLYYRQIIEYTSTLDYWISTDALIMSEDTNINPPQSELDKDEDIRTVQYMEPNNEIIKDRLNWN